MSLAGLFAICFLLFAFCVPVLAQIFNEGYVSDEPLQKGMLVMVSDAEQRKVEKLKASTLDQVKGVVVQRNDSPVTLSRSGQDIFVGTSGIYDVLVSTENGEVKENDYISISSVDGIGMKATDEQSIVVGQATGGFKGQEDSIGSYADPKTKQKISFGRIPVAISIDKNPWLRETPGSVVPRPLQKIGVTIAGKPVNTARIWLAVAVFLGTIFVVGTMLYSGARSGIISVGRNPLSKGIIIKGLLQVVILSVIVFITGMFGVYLLLKL